MDSIVRLDSRSSKRAPQKTTKSIKVKAPTTESQALVSSSSDDKKSPAQKKIDTFLQFAFQMDSIILNLYTGKNPTDSISNHFLNIHFFF